MITFRRVTPNAATWERIHSCYDYTPFKSEYWLKYLSATYHVGEYILEIEEARILIGFFVGVKLKRVVTIIAAPFEGLYTPFQGLCFLSERTIKKRLEVYVALKDYLFAAKECMLFQVCDWHLEVPHVALADLPFELHKGYLLDISNSERDIFLRMGGSAQKPIKAAKHRRFTIREPEDINRFISTYYDQMSDVFKKQDRQPTHRFADIRNQIQVLHQCKRMLALELLSSANDPLASTLFVYDNEIAFWLGTVSFSANQKLSPNEPLMFEAITRLKKLGVKRIELGGGRRYKEKYGPEPFVKPKLVFAKYRWILLAKRLARSIYYSVVLR